MHNNKINLEEQCAALESYKTAKWLINESESSQNEENENLSEGAHGLSRAQDIFEQAARGEGNPTPKANQEKDGPSQKAGTPGGQPGYC